MNTQTLEEMHDDLAYPLKTYRKPMSMDELIAAMKADAKDIKKRRGPAQFIPTAAQKDDSVGRKNRDDICEVFRAHGPMTYQQAAKHMTISETNVRQYMATLRASGRLVAIKHRCIRGLNVLATQVADYPEYFKEAEA